MLLSKSSVRSRKISLKNIIVITFIIGVIAYPVIIISLYRYYDYDVLTFANESSDSNDKNKQCLSTENEICCTTIVHCLSTE